VFYDSTPAPAPAAAPAANAKAAPMQAATPGPGGSSSIKRLEAHGSGGVTQKDQVVTGEALPPFDLQISLLSLPEVFRTGLDSIPAEIPYLNVPDRVPHRQAIAEALAASAGKTRVGIVWAGSPGHARDRERSLPAGALAPLGSLPGVAWHSFQLGPAAENPLPGMVSLAPLLADFPDTAYALTGMDLVIAVDTALVHLAGALGIPVLLLSAFGPDFRWLLHRGDSPWYPTVRVYRQPVPGDWATVIGQVLGDLE